MFLKVLRAKIHRATVTQAEIDYVGSITLDPLLVEAAGMVAGECVLVADLSNGQRFETYVVLGERGSGTVCINGAAARIVHIGDKLIVMSFAYISPEQAKQLQPRIALVDEKNRIVKQL